jgi:hypothetical protein
VFDVAADLKVKPSISSVVSPRQPMAGETNEHFTN